MMIYGYLYEDQVWQSPTIWFLSEHGGTIATKYLRDFALEHLAPRYFNDHPGPDQYDEHGRKCVRFLKLAEDVSEVEARIRAALGDPAQYSFEPPTPMPEWMREEERDAEFWAQVPQEAIWDALARKA
jgi:hypothetical protein